MSSSPAPQGGSTLNNRPSESKTTEEALRLLHDLTDAIYHILCESNGLSDNEWKVDGKRWTARYPNRGYAKCLDKASAVYGRAMRFLDPEKAAKQEQWMTALNTARYIVKRHNTEQRDGSLERNIADAIFGSITATEDNPEPATMMDRLNALVENGKLFKYEAGKEASSDV